tara:strand:- start:100 stop:303 length:204 start_codon:yes stop_codon:yes gene_type:complete
LGRSTNFKKLEKLQEDLLIIKECIYNLKKLRNVGIVEAKKNILIKQKNDILKEIYQIEGEFRIIGKN